MGSFANNHERLYVMNGIGAFIHVQWQQIHINAQTHTCTYSHSRLHSNMLQEYRQHQTKVDGTTTLVTRADTSFEANTVCVCMYAHLHKVRGTHPLIGHLVPEFTPLPSSPSAGSGFGCGRRWHLSSRRRMCMCVREECVRSVNVHV